MSEIRDIRDYLLDIQEALDNLVFFVEGMTFDEFSRDAKTVYAVIRAFEIAGEAARKIPGNIKDEFRDIPWRVMSDMRNKMIHEYFGVDLEIVWQTIIDDVPPLRERIHEMVARLIKHSE